MRFAKPALSIADQLALLERRGMIVADRGAAEHYLQHISYYRLRAYWLPFEIPAPTAGDHQFRPGTTFDEVLSLYVFDRRLRLLVMDAIERVEVSLRGAWAHHLAMKYGPHGYLEAKLYWRRDRYVQALKALAEEVSWSKDTFISHYKTKYSDPTHPPIWMAAEILSLGHLSKWFSNLRLRADRQSIARPYGLDESVLASIVHHLTYVRNICAHHGRLWNKQFTVTMIVPRSPAALGSAVHAGSERRLYNTLATIGYLLELVAPASDWRAHIVALLDEFPVADPTDMSFPQGWRALPAWKAVALP